MVDVRRSNRTRRGLVVGVLGALLVTAVTLAILTPRVVTLEPRPGAVNVGGQTPIRITFSQTVDPATFASKFEISPAVEGNLEIRERTLRFQPDPAWPDGARVEVELQPGSRSRLGLPLLRGASWTFQIAPARLLYVYQAGSEPELRTHVVGETSAEGGADEADLVYEFDLAANGRLATLVRGSDGEQLLRLAPGLEGEEARDLYSCPTEVRCREVTISGEAQFVAWTQQNLSRLDSGVVKHGPNEVWLLDIGASEAIQLDPDGPELRSPQWLADGRLAAYSEEELQLHVYEQVDPGEWLGVVVADHQLGSQWTWSPDARFVVFPEVELLSGVEARGQVDYYSHLQRVELETGVRTDLSESAGELVEDGSPVYSPDGLMLAFSRRWLDRLRWTLGRQLWVMRADGSGATALTDSPSFAHSNFAWSPSGEAIAYVRIDQSQAQAEPEIWIYDFVAGREELVVEGGHSPAWLSQSQ